MKRDYKLNRLLSVLLLALPLIVGACRSKTDCPDPEPEPEPNNLQRLEATAWEGDYYNLLPTSYRVAIAFFTGNKGEFASLDKEASDYQRAFRYILDEKILNIYDSGGYYGNIDGHWWIIKFTDDELELAQRISQPVEEQQRLVLKRVDPKKKK